VLLGGLVLRRRDPLPGLLGLGLRLILLLEPLRDRLLLLLLREGLRPLRLGSRSDGVRLGVRERLRLRDRLIEALRVRDREGIFATWFGCGQKSTAKVKKHAVVAGSLTCDGLILFVD
jgi:hypothetical protein